MDTIPQNNPPSKQCTRCKRLLPLTEDFFCKSKRTKTGFYYICKECRRTGRPSENPRKVDGIPEGFKRCTKCKEILPATVEYFYKYPSGYRQGKLFPRCRKCCSAYSKVYNDAHKEEHKQYHLEHKEEKNEKQRRHRALHRDEINEKRRRDYQLHRARYLVWSRVGWQKRRMRKKNVEGSLTAQEIRTKLKAQHYKCYYCGKRFEKRKGKHVYHLDHTVPLSRIEENPRHDINYVVLTCSHCNLSKRNKLPHEWPQGGRLM